MAESQDANQSSTQSSSVENQDSSSQSQGTANSSTQNGTVSNGNEFHNHPRFQELVQEKNTMKREMEAMKLQMVRERQQQSQQHEDQDVVQELATMYGVEPDVAGRLVNTFGKIAERRANRIVQPTSETVLKTRIEQRIGDFKRDNADFDTYLPTISEIWSSLSEEDKYYLSKTSKGGIDILYNAAKIKDLPKLQKDIKNEGRNEAYQNQNLKNSMSSSTSASVGKNDEVLNLDDIRNMSPDEYTKRKKAIDEAFEKAVGIKR